MDLLYIQHRIAKLMALFVTQVKSLTAMSKTDINHTAETVLIPLLSEIFGCKNLVNLNFFEDKNYPAIDLGDTKKRIAFQITSTPSSEKINETLRKFIEYEQHNDFDRIIIYIISEKQKTYQGKSFDEIIGDKFKFDKKTDIMDFRDILHIIDSYQIDKAIVIRDILEKNFNNDDFRRYYSPSERKERMYTNMVEITFLSDLYIAPLRDDLDISGSFFKNKAQKALANLGLRFSVDWVYFEDKIITFHDLSDSSIPLYDIIDPGAMEIFDPQDFYTIDDDHERVFISLLRRCLQQKLYKRGVKWQHEEKLFIFGPNDDEDIRIERWQGDKFSDRRVFVRTMNKNNPEKILNCKHFAFDVQFKIVNNNWYLVILPDWFFSFDGYRKSFFSSDNLKWIKKNEDSSHVYNHVRFIIWFLKRQSTMLETTYPYLEFGEPVTFDGAPYLDDEDWRPASSKDGKEQDSNQIPIIFDEEDL